MLRAICDKSSPQIMWKHKGPEPFRDNYIPNPIISFLPTSKPLHRSTRVMTHLNPSQPRQSTLSSIAAHCNNAFYDYYLSTLFPLSTLISSYPTSAHKMSQHFTITQATSPSDLDSIRTLFSAYVSWLDIDLTFQDFSTELATLPGLYIPPTGCLLLAKSTTPSSTIPLGCIAVRPLKSTSSTASKSNPDSVKDGSTKICEMKRLYTIPSARGLGVGKR